MGFPFEKSLPVKRIRAKWTGRIKYLPYIWWKIGYRLFSFLFLRSTWMTRDKIRASAVVWLFDENKMTRKGGSRFLVLFLFRKVQFLLRSNCNWIIIWNCLLRNAGLSDKISGDRLWKMSRRKLKNILRSMGRQKSRVVCEFSFLFKMIISDILWIYSVLYYKHYCGKIRYTCLGIRKLLTNTIMCLKLLYQVFQTIMCSPCM